MKKIIVKLQIDIQLASKVNKFSFLQFLLEKEDDIHKISFEITSLQINNGHSNY